MHYSFLFTPHYVEQLEYDTRSCTVLIIFAGDASARFLVGEIYTRGSAKQNDAWVCSRGGWGTYGNVIVPLFLL